jgi:hypothetical protein
VERFSSFSNFLSLGAPCLYVSQISVRRKTRLRAQENAQGAKHQ